MNKILSLIAVLLLVSCGASKSGVSKKNVGYSATKNTTKPKEVAEIPKKVSTSIDNTSSAVEILEATQKIRVTTVLVMAYIAQFKDVAKESMLQDGIPASITLAQGILESGAGTGDLSRQANNHFGIKCHKEWSGPSIKHNDDAPNECFRKYGNAAESYRDHASFLKSRPWYKPLFLLQKDDYKGWAKGLKKAGYATDVKYPQKLMGIIERYELQRYDAEVLGLEFVPKAELHKLELPIAVATTQSVVPANSFYTVEKGDTLYSISRKFSLSVEQLKSKNNISDSALWVGQRLSVK